MARNPRDERNHTPPPGSSGGLFLKFDDGQSVDCLLLQKPIHVFHPEGQQGPWISIEVPIHDLDSDTCRIWSAGRSGQKGLAARVNVIAAKIAKRRKAQITDEIIGEAWGKLFERSLTITRDGTGKSTSYAVDANDKVDDDEFNDAFERAEEQIETLLDKARASIEQALELGRKADAEQVAASIGEDVDDVAFEDNDDDDDADDDAGF